MIEEANDGVFVDEFTYRAARAAEKGASKAPKVPRSTLKGHSSSPFPRFKIVNQDKGTVDG